uniref:Dolichyl-P-Glc:Glc(2)Man(9)GlcNAc(2)-PP-dolichol alpha-1,2-glucosyltransferase n=1 Tax=Elaeophora elaphi TaxID=1147741 RepID=A0A158Q713_9BILA
FKRYVKRLGSEIIWTTNDTKYSITCSLVPCAISLNSFLSVSNDQNAAKIWKDPHIYGLLDVLTMSPLGYAAYRIYKYGGGFVYDDTKFALGLYGITLLFALSSLPFTKVKNRSSQFNYTFLMHLTALGSTYTFHKIDKRAGILVLPYAIWTGFYALLAYAMK